MSCPKGMKTYDYLAQELEAAGLTGMAKRAKEKYYHDFFSPLDLPELQLLTDLDAEVAKARTGGDVERYNKIAALRLRHIEGEFDSSIEESDEWVMSAEGQAALNHLVNGGKS